MRQLDVDVEKLRGLIRARPEDAFASPPPGHTIDDDEACDFPEEKEILAEFRKSGARIFESRLSPFHTGSMSVRGVKSLLYAPKASMPREIGGPLRELPLEIQDGDTPELRRHKEIYAGGDFQTIMHCYVPEAEASAHFVHPGETEPLSRLIPIDAEGSFIHLAVPVVAAQTRVEELIRLLHDYMMVIVRGGGVWAVGGQSLSEVLHHPSSLREICLYQIGAHELGLDLRPMEPEKAKKW